MAVLVVFVFPALTALVVPAAGALRRLTRRPATRSATWRAARSLAAGAAVLGVAFLLALTATLLGNTDEFLYRVPLSFRLLLGVPIVVLAAAVAATAYTIKGWRGSGAGILARVHQVVLLAGMVGLAWFLWQWNLIGWQYA